MGKLVCITRDAFLKSIKANYSLNAVALDLKIGKLRVIKLIKEFNCDISHFDKKGNWLKRVVPLIQRQCPSCKVSFTCKQTSKKVCCSKACSNSFFPRQVTKHYVKICFKHKKYVCYSCGENRVVEVHHIDFNHKNDKLENLIPLCPTCHALVHKPLYRKEIENKFQRSVV